MRFMLALLLFSFVAAPHAHADRLTGVASVIDGDTLEIRGQRIRLHGIDAPESRQLCATPEGQRWRCGQQAALSLANRIGRQQLSCTVRDIDRYGRFIAVCHQDGTDLNAWLVREGWAVAYRRYSRDYIRDETEARSARRNIWSGRFDMPWDWRRAQRGG
ncbi:thermonuclease family protein [Sulfitobacter sp. HNIBRBA3233]|uniref:thermonuclease family protein n=1 Tax=Sulfitobacter marinivivus TaxID=3158558 RepID=UPI0032DEFB29